MHHSQFFFDQHSEVEIGIWNCIIFVYDFFEMIAVLEFVFSFSLKFHLKKTLNKNISRLEDKNLKIKKNMKN